jgi:hypothetical protein
MHLLYLDDSGSAPNAREEYLALGGVAVHEAQALWITQELDRPSCVSGSMSGLPVRWGS